MEPKIDRMEHDLFSKLVPGRAIALDGPNFSGRTDLLRWLTGLDARSEEGIVPARPTSGATVYIGPEIYNAISGLCSTVQEELRLHSASSSEGFSREKLAGSLGLLALYDRNPFTLSGGEQALLTLISALALQPSILAIDCALEQLEPRLKFQVLRSFRHDIPTETSIVITDNRMSECEEFNSLDHLTSIKRSLTFQNQLQLGPIRGEVDPPVQAIRPSRLVLDSIKFQYRRGPKVLKNISVQLEPGKLYLLQGKNGAGKSTLAKLLSGVLKPEGGRILCGQTEVSPWKHPGQLVAYHFQNPDLQLFSTSVEEEIQAGPHALGLHQDELTHRSEAVMCSFGLSHIRKEHPLDLPFVIRKRVALAATIAMGCPWVILDEPTLGQDSQSAEAIARIVSALLACGTGVIVISHSIWFRRRLSAQALWLDRGVLSIEEGGISAAYNES